MHRRNKVSLLFKRDAFLSFVKIALVKLKADKVAIFFDASNCRGRTTPAKTEHKSTKNTPAGSLRQGAFYLYATRVNRKSGSPEKVGGEK